MPKFRSSQMQLRTNTKATCSANLPWMQSHNFGRPKTHRRTWVVYRLSLAHVRNIAGFDSVSGQPI